MFIDASALGELPTQLLTQQDLESLVLTNIQAADLEALQEAETHVSNVFFFFYHHPTIFHLSTVHLLTPSLPPLYSCHCSL